MRSFKPEASLSGRTSLCLGIASSLRRALGRGQLLAGEWLPSTRALAEEYGVHRHTVQAALELLESEGALTAVPRRGFQVTTEAPVTKIEGGVQHGEWQGFRIVREGAERVSPPVSSVPYPLHSATPDPALVPHAELKAAYAHVLRRRRSELFEAGDERGFEPFRKVFGDHLRQQRGLVARELMVTHGSQEAIALVGRALLGPGDCVAVEDPGYPPAWQAFRDAGATVVGVRVDEHGLDVDAFERLAQKRRVRLLYVTPGHQFPTSVTLSHARRARLLESTARLGIPILEDDYDHEYQYVGLPLPPLAAARDAEHVIYVATLSKLVGSGFRIGCVVAAPTLIEALVRLCRLGTRGHDTLSQAALAAWMNEGGLSRHLRRARRAYAERREALLQALSPAIEAGTVSVRAPSGGLGLWLRWHGVNSHALAIAARQRGLLVLPEELLRVKGGVHEGTRMAFSRCSPEQLAHAARELTRLSRS